MIYFQIALGLFFYLDHTGSPAIQNIMWLPVTSLVIFIVAYGIGYGPIPWALLGEMFSVSVKSYAATVATSVCWGTGFLMILIFEWLIEILGVYGSFWVYAGFAVSGVIFIMALAIETKGLSVQEIQNRLQR